MESLLILHAVAAICAPWLARRLGRGSFAVLAVPPACGFGYAVWAAANEPVTSARPWAPALGLELAFRADPLALLMMALVTGVGALVLIYSMRYFRAGDEGLGRYGGVMVAFAGAMLGLVIADDLLLLYVFWELTTVFSYLLIGYHPESRASRRAALVAVTVTTFGGLTMLAGLVLIGEAAGTYRISVIVADPPPATWAVVLVLVGALSKSAIFPFSLWLPAAMAAPTPVSAYLHAAAMVKAGIYLLARLGPAFGDLALWRALAVPLGVLTMLLGGWRALRETDLKRLLAYGTVSQLGLLTALFGAGTRDSALAGVAMLLGHALFKAALFLVVGVVDRATGTRDLRALSGLRRSMPWVCAVAVSAGASMAGLPPFMGFVGKEAALESFLTGEPAATAILAGIVLGSALTAAYTLRFLWGAFAGKPGRGPTPVLRPAAASFAPPALLSVLGLAVAPLAPAFGAAMTGYTAEFPPGHGTHLALWSGAPVPLALSALALLAGVGLFLAREPVARLGTSLHIVDSGHVYWSLMRRLDLFSVQITGITQRGSLPDYLMLALVAMIGLGAFSLGYGRPPVLDVTVVGWERVEQPIVVVLLIASAVLALYARAYILVAVVSGLTGYGAALLFLVHGSPDLALTQFLAETLSLVVFALVLRRLPLEADRGRLRFGFRLALGAVVGVVAAGAGMLAMSARVAEPAGAHMARAAQSAGAHNIVSALLLDIRAWDTMGESSVIVVLALGVTSLVFLRRRTYSIEREGGEQPPGRTHWLASTLPPGQRALVFEIVARLTFHSVLLLSVFLLVIGHTRVGGGFAGGIVAGLAITVRYLAGGRYELARAVPVHAGVLMGIGLTLSTGTALAGLVLGRAALDILTVDVTVPVLDHLHLSTGLVFDLGVYLAVVGLVQDVLRGLGAELDRQIDAETA
ncbi:Na+/H+ antiporter subunit A [Nonomuraea sp. NPDC048916]|uniref:Na+/H+ antiporter subunit A n=1 Tax=Nonomuraea sp. NPDC048916 TaxID=3154232 RepID=UPI0033C58732